MRTRRPLPLLVRLIDAVVGSPLGSSEAELNLVSCVSRTPRMPVPGIFYGLPLVCWAGALAELIVAFPLAGSLR